MANNSFSCRARTTRTLPIVAPQTEAPAFTAAPAIGGPASQAYGAVLTGTYTATGIPAPTPVFAWSHNGTLIPGATSSTFDTSSLSVTGDVTLSVTITNGIGAPVTLVSAPVTITVPALAPPAFTSGPTIVGDTLAGSALTLVYTATGTPTPSATFVWKDAGTAISGATSSTYVSSAGQVLTGEVVLTNTVGAPVAGTSPVLAVSSLTLRQQIEGLSTQITPNGRQSTATLQVASVGNLPPGCTISGNNIVFSGNGITLTDWDFTNKRVEFTGTDQTIQNCYWGPTQSVPAAQYCVQFNATAVRPKLRYNTMDGFDGYGGPGAFINFPTTGSGATATGAQDWLIEYNRFLYPNSDVIKAAGNGINQWNYFGPLTNYPAGTLPWSAGTTYAAGQFVTSIVNTSPALFRSFAGGNAGNAPPTSKVNTAAWESLDPHGDAITQTGSDGVGVVHRRNLIDWGPALVRGVGVTQAVRIVRNTGVSTNMGPVDFTENVIPGAYAGFYPLATGQIRDWTAGTTYPLGGFAQVGIVKYVSLIASNLGNEPTVSTSEWAVTTNINDPGPIRYMNNWVGVGSTGAYFIPPMTDAVDAWSGNRDAVTDTLIPGPALRVTTINPVIGILTQSQSAYILNNGSFYRAIPQPVGAGVAANVTSYIDNDTGAGPSKIEVTATNVSAGLVNPVVANWGVFWNHVMPGTHFNIADMAVPGTSRMSIAQDGHPDNRWPGFLAMTNLVRANHSDFDAIVDIWMGNDGSTAKTFNTEWAPFYVGQRAGGGAFTLGTVNPDSTANPSGVINHCLWDVTAAPTATGRGVFKQRRTKLYFSGWPTFSGSPASPTEMRNSSTSSTGTSQPSYPSLLDMPARQKLDDFLASYPTLAGSYIGMSHGANMNGNVHPVVSDPEGMINIGWGIAIAALKVAGYNVAQPTITGTQTAIDGSYVDVLVSLPNGGDLTTYEELQNLPAATVEPPHYQPIMGFEIRRAADPDNARRPVYKTTETTYPINHRGTVAIQSVGTGTGVARVGRIRVTPVTPFVNGDMLYFGRGDTSMILQNPRDIDAKLYRRQPLEHIAAFYDATATYPCPGILIKPQPPVLTISGIGAADTTAPVLSAVGVTNTGSSATLAWSTSDPNGTAYWMVDTVGSRTASEVIAGGGAASGSRVVTASGTQASFTAFGLAATTAYHFYLVHVDAAGNTSTVSDVTFTTAAAGAPTFFATASGPYFVGQTNLPTTSQITFAYRIKPSATGALRYLFEYAATSMSADITTTGSLRIGVEDATGATIRALTGTGVTVANGVWTTLIIAIDLAAATLTIRKDGVLTSIALATTTSPTFQTTRRGTILNRSTPGSNFAAEVEYIKIWYSAVAGGTEPVVAPFTTIAGSAVTVNALTTPFLTSGSPAT